MKVRCINDGWGYGLSIEIGDTFDITKDTMNFYYIGEKMYPKWMFEEVKEETKMKVRCIEPIGFSPEFDLVMDEIYEVNKETESSYELVINYWWYLKERFEVVDESSINFKFGLVNTIVINGIEYISWYDIPLAVRGTIPTYLYQPVYQFLTDNLMRKIEEADKEGYYIQTIPNWKGE